MSTLAPFSSGYANFAAAVSPTGGQTYGFYEVMGNTDGTRKMMSFTPINTPALTYWNQDLGNGYTGWKRINGLSETVGLAGVSDLNSCQYAGTYIFNNTTSNRPCNYGICFTIATSAPDNDGIGWVMQLAFGADTNSILYMRKRINNGAWHAWKSITFT